MKTFQRLLGILLVTVASAGLMAACGETANNDCITSEDCADGDVCNLDTETCGFSCTAGNGDCLDDEICDTDATSGDGGVCVIDGTTEPECTADADCDTANGETCNADGVCEGGDTPACTENSDCDEAAGEFCNPAGECETPGADYPFALISDVSEDIPALCGNSDPGADIFAVELVKGGTSFWAQFESVAGIETAGNDEASPVGIIDGQPPGLTDDCPESFSGNVVALGCGGSMVVSFINDAAETQFIEGGDTITVYEYGAQCNNGAADQDDWSVSICEASSDAASNECAGEVAVGDGTGIASTTVPDQSM
jgi:hypothetical protein